MGRSLKLFSCLNALALAGVAASYQLALGTALGCIFAQPALAGSKSKSGEHGDSKQERGNFERSDRAFRDDRSDRKNDNDKPEQRNDATDKGGSDKDSAGGKDAAKSDAASGKSDDKGKSDQAGTDSKSDKDNGGKVPATVEEWLNGVLKPKPSASPQPTPVEASKPQPGSRSVVPDLLAVPAFGRPELLVVNASKSNIDKAVALRFRVTGQSGVSSLKLGLTRLAAPDGYDADQARELLQQAFPPADIEANKKYRIFRTANGALPASRAETVRDPIPMATPCGSDRCFGISIMGWSEKLQDCARSLRIGVIDTGYDKNHPAFKNRVIEPRSSVQAGRSRSPDWHGTGVLALLAGETKSGTPGLIPDAKLFMADIFYADTDGAPASDTASLIEALDWLDKQKVSIINMSLTGPPDELLKRAILGLSQKGIIFVAAVGNDGPSAPPSYPAAYEPVLAVTAVDRNMKGYRYASRGDHVDVAAPGVDIWTAMPEGRAGYHSGTSFAVPYVTAVLATVYRSLEHKTKYDFLKQAITVDLGDPGRDPVYGNGLLVAPLSCNLPTATATAKSKPIEPAGLLSQNR